MTSLPGFSLAAELVRKQDAQLATFGFDLEYESRTAGLFPFRAIRTEGAQEGTKIYIALHAKPGDFPTPPLAGDRVFVSVASGLVERDTWYTVMDPKVEDGWQKMLLHYKGLA